MREDTQAEFPRSFLWGASTASYQVEGGNHNQWSVWEQATAEDRAKTAHQRYGWQPNWSDIKEQAEDPANYISGEGVDRYNRYVEDFELAKQLNLNSFRFGIEWSRIEPAPGVWDELEVEHYRKYIAALKHEGLEPVMNIWHWTMPTWFTDMGAFEKRANIAYFTRFVKKIAEEYAHEIKYVITLNEPNVYTSLSYQTGQWPPQKKSLTTMLRVYSNLSKAHKRSYEILKTANPKLQVGIAMHLTNIQAKDPHDIPDEISTKIMRYVWNWRFINSIKDCQDFLGFNYYRTEYYDGIFNKTSPTVPLNDLGWYMEPEGLYPLLLRAWQRYKKPIMITENGVADAKDEYRRWWIEESIVAMERALSQGVQMIGYMHWSLLDNFEWADGWWPKFGLIEVDRKNGMKRTIRPSAKWFAERITKLTS